ncbi:MAG TPA: hypothetical protein VJK29_04260 [Terriglobales bacterium]|nr:hypothetical protein [Terriglobales bacterium]
MIDRAPGNSATSAPNSQSSATPREGRNVWILTAYGISGLVLFGVLVYYFCTYITQ